VVFNSWVFAAFFVLVYLAYLRIDHDEQNWLLLVASYTFYGWWDYRFLALIFASTLMDYLCGRAMEGKAKPVQRRYVAISVIGNLSVLGFFKYYDFFVTSVAAGFGHFGVTVPLPVLKVVLPAGISFYTFQELSYVIDIYRDHVSVCRSLRDFALFVTFFPHLVAGPIQPAHTLIGQVARPRVLVADKLWSGLWQVLLGFFMKVFVADNAGGIADTVFNGEDPANGLACLLGIYAFALQIYGDFGGYSLMARGLARLLGFELMVNFRQPYLATHPSDFWRRWHISLSTWLRDYLYIPLGGNRGGVHRTYTNLVITMLLGGLWHGAAWKYLAWGLYHGLLLVAFRSRPESAGRVWTRPLRVFGFFQLTALAWLIFRCNDLPQAASFLAEIVHLGSWAVGESEATQLAALGIIAAAVLLLDLWLEYGERLWSWLGLAEASLRIRVPVALAFAMPLITLIALLGDRGHRAFIYFQF
jgi:D-alanyl-lipoteichoic acid acyltransferase DltB (MBOAT superfamily)